MSNVRFYYLHFFVFVKKIVKKISIVLRDLGAGGKIITDLDNAVFLFQLLELVSKELNPLAAFLHVYAGGLIFMKNFIKSSKRAK